MTHSLLADTGTLTHWLSSHTLKTPVLHGSTGRPISWPPVRLPPLLWQLLMLSEAVTFFASVVREIQSKRNTKYLHVNDPQTSLPCGHKNSTSLVAPSLSNTKFKQKIICYMQQRGRNFHMGEDQIRPGGGGGCIVNGNKHACNSPAVK